MSNHVFLGVSRRLAPSLRVLALVLAWPAVSSIGCGDEMEGNPAVRLAELEDPPPTVRPAVRWWWPGGAVEATQIGREVETIAEAGFGAVEIQAFDAALDDGLGDGFRARVRDVRSDRFSGLVDAAMDAAAANGLAVDLTIGSGWPVGGSQVSVDDASTTLMWWEQTTSGPAELSVEPTPRPTVFFTVADIAAATFGERLGRFLPNEAVPVGAWAGRVVEGRRDPSPLVLDDTVVIDPESLVDLSGEWGADGVLRWQVPPGRWHIVAVFAGPAGDYITLTAEPGDPFAADHLDAAAVRGALDSWFPDTTRWPALRGVFNDSLEFKVDRLFTDDFLEEFEARRGYALDGRILAALSQSADSFLLDAGRVRVAPEIALDEYDGRVRWDYRRTVSELFVERFVSEAAAWGAERGVELRSQSYGIDVDVIAALGAADVPEVETLYAGGSKLFTRLASSAAWLNGRSRASAEAFSFILRDHMTTPLKLRAVADGMFSVGITDLVFHGFPYAAEGDYGLPEWTPFSSPFGGTSTFGSTFGPRWEFFEWIPQITTYVARTQSLLRSGDPGADLLVVYPHMGFPTSLALAESYYEPLLGGHIPEAEPASRDVPFAELAALLGPPVDDPRVTWLVALAAVLDPLESCGWTWSWVNPGGLDALTVNRGTIRSGRAEYGMLVVFDTDALTVGAASAIRGLAEQGASVAFVGARPSTSPSFAERELDASVAASVEAALRVPTVVSSETGDGLAALLDGRSPRMRTECGGVQRSLWRHDGRDTWLAFVHNPTGAAATQTWTIDGCDRPIAYDAWAHTAEPFDTELELPPYSSSVVVCGGDAAGVPAAPAVSGPSIDVTGWSLSVEKATDSADVVAAVPPVLGDWRDHEDLAGRSGRGTYTATLELDAAPARAALEVGWVHGTAVVSVNGASVGEMVVPPWRVDLSGVLQAGANAIEITVMPPLRNELLALGLAGASEYGQFVGKEGTEVASGVVGPVVVRVPSDEGSGSLAD